MCIVCMLLSIAVVPAPGVSTARIAIDGRGVRFVLRLPLDEIDLVLRLDRDLDGQVSQGELDASRDRFSAYVAKHLHVTADATPLTAALERLVVRRDARARRRDHVGRGPERDAEDDGAVDARNREGARGFSRAFTRALSARSRG